MKTSPLVSVIVPTYNGIRYIAECVDSILNQTYKYIELILIDDCSTDNTPKFLKEYEYLDNVKIIFNQKNMGMSASVNKALSYVSGDYLIIHGHDDVMLLNRIESQVEFMNQKKGAAIIFANSFLIINDELTNKPVIKSTIKRKIFNYFPSLFSLLMFQFNSTCNMFSVDALKKCGGYNESFGNYGESELYYRMSLEGPVYYQDIILSYYRIHETNITKKIVPNLQSIERLKYIHYFFNNNNFKYKRLYYFMVKMKWLILKK